jgi:hypothetical protein
MPTYSKNLHYLKETLFSKLNTDVTLRGLLGGSGKIFHRDTPQEANYPCIVYAVIDDRDNPYDESSLGGQVTRSNFRITIFSNNSKTEESDNIEARIKTLLHGQRTLDSTKIICYSCLRDSLVEPIKDPNLQVWVIPIRYRVTWATK